MESLTLFLELIERLIIFINGRKESKKALFDEVVEPVFKQLEALIDDYFLLFRNAHKAIEETEGTEWHLAVEEIRSNRETMWTARKKVSEFALVAAEKLKDQKFVSFAKKVSRLFHATEYHESRKLSRSLEVLDLLEALDAKTMEKHKVLERLAQTERQLKETWVSLAQSYAGLKLYSLK